MLLSSYNTEKLHFDSIRWDFNNIG